MPAVDSTHRPRLVSPEIWRDGKEVSKEIGSNRRLALNVSPFLFDRFPWSQPQCAIPYPVQGSCQNHRIPTDGRRTPLLVWMPLALPPKSSTHCNPMTHPRSNANREVAHNRRKPDTYFIKCKVQNAVVFR